MSGDRIEAFISAYDPVEKMKKRVSFLVGIWYIMYLRPATNYITF